MLNKFAPLTAVPMPLPVVQPVADVSGAGLKVKDLTFDLRDGQIGPGTMNYHHHNRHNHNHES